MTAKQPVGKIGRALSGGNTAARIGGKVALYYAKRPFMNQAARSQAHAKAIRESAQTLFKGLSLLKGTALKMAQLLSLEMDLLPEAACRELAKAYHQVPPINRALVRKVVRDGLGQPPETLFEQFDLQAFAAASLGQVHAAKAHDQTPLAVKIQYPGIAKTIDSDMSLLRQMLRPLIQGDQLSPILDEVADRLHEEVDYRREADQLTFFAEHLTVKGVRIPEVRTELSSGTVLTTTRMSGKPLDLWLQDHPDQQAIDRVAQTLQEVILAGLYELNILHADPNPGNFIIADDLTVGLVDFGCVKRLDPVFVEHYRRLAATAFKRQSGDHFREMVALGLIPPESDDRVLTRIRAVSDAIGGWFGQLCATEQFDFRHHPDFIGQGKETMRDFHGLRKHVRINPDFIFLDRTRYGLLRLFEKMGARVRFRNRFEWT